MNPLRPLLTTTQRGRLLLGLPLMLAIACERAERDAASVGAESAVSQSISRSTSLEGNTIEIRLDREQVLVGDPIRLIVVATPAADRIAARLGAAMRMSHDFRVAPPRALWCQCCS